MAAIPMLVKSICLSGGGLSGFAHIGFLQRLVDEDTQIQSRIDTIVATSTGSVIALFFAIGITPQAIFRAFVAIDADRVFQFANVANFFISFGIDSGKLFMAHLVDILLEYVVSPLVTFAEIQKQFNKRLIFTGTNVSQHRLEYFSCDTTPDMRVLDAVRISISIPFIFDAVLLNGEYYVDGGLMLDYPLEKCISDFKERNPILDPRHHVLGCKLDPFFTHVIDGIENYIYNLYACTVRAATIGNDECIHTVYVHDRQLKYAMNLFNVTEKDRDTLFRIGYDAAKTTLASRQKASRPSRRYSL